MATPYLIGLANQQLLSVKKRTTIDDVGPFPGFASDEKLPIVIPRRVSDTLKESGLEVDCDGVLHWAEDSITHPRKWRLLRKVYDTAVICFLEFFVTVISNTGSSMAPLAAGELGISAEVALFSFTTLYLIGQAIGGLVFPPIAESFGSRTIYLTSTLGYAALCLITAAWLILPVVILGRFGTGLLSAMPAVVATSSIENMWDMRSRAFVVHLWICGAIAGLAVGPAFGTFISHSSRGWRFVFTVAAATTGLATLLCLGMQESRPSKVLRQHVKEISQITDFDGLSLDSGDSLPTVKAFLRSSLIMPLWLFITEPIVLLTSIMAATVVSITYMFSNCLDVVYIDEYGFNAREASLVLMPVAVGIIFTFSPRLYDIHIARCRKRQSVMLQPEDKLFGFFVAAPALAAALWWFAWTVPPLVAGLSPYVLMGALVLIGFSVVEFDAVLSGYLCDTYAAYAASANASLACLRCILSGVFPLFGPSVFRKLGPNYALFALAGVATAYCAVALLFGLYRKQIRERSPFATKTWSTTIDEDMMMSDRVSQNLPAKSVLS